MDDTRKAVGIFIAAFFVMLFMSFAVTSVSAQLANSGFETGDFSGWTVSIPVGGSAQVVTSHTSDLGTVYQPVGGACFALLKTNGPGSYTNLTQSFDISAGENISGWAAFDAQELPEEWYNDNASVRILDSSMNVIATPWYSDVVMVGPIGDSPWTYWEWTAPSSGTYVLELRVANDFDSSYDSYALFDSSEPRPSPPPLPPCGTGFFETGNFNGWTVSIPDGGSAQVVTSHTGDQGYVYQPVGGTYFALLKTDGPGSYTTASRRFYILGGDTVLGWAAFDSRDVLPFNDNATVRILDSSMNVIATPWYSDVAMVGTGGDGPWTYWEWTAPATGIYIIELRICNSLDSIADSYALFDGCLPQAEAPTLTPIGLIALIGLLSTTAVLTMRRKRR